MKRDDERSERPAVEGQGESIPLLLARRSRAPGPPPTKPARKPRPQPEPVPPGGVRSVTRTVLRSRLGAIGLGVSLLLLVVALLADILASELPVVCSIGGRVLVLPAMTRPSAIEGKTPEDIYREATFVLPPLVRHGPHAPSDDARLAGPLSGTGHPFGTDRAGRDVFARVVHGARSYLLFASAAVVASLALGAMLGALAGLFGGTTDALLGRAIESISAFPPLVLVLGIQAAVPRPTLATLFFAVALTRWPEVARLVRGEVMLAATRDYVLAARALGASPWRILVKHIAPNIRGPLIVGAALGISAVVLTEASLDFLRVGIPGGSASWGETMSEIRDAPHAYWLLLFPGTFLFATVIAHNLLGEAFRSALAPRGR